MAVEIPDKNYFKIGEVGRILGVEPYNIRYWESQFRAIRPLKTKSNQRLYRRRDIKLLLEIKHLLYEEGFTIAGAKKRLKSSQEGEDAEPKSSSQQLLGLAAEERRAYEAVLSRSQTELVDLRAQVQELKEALQQLRTQHTSQVTELEAQRQELVARLEAWEPTAQEVGDLHSQLVEANVVREELQRRASQAQDLAQENERLVELLRQSRADHERLIDDTNQLKNRQQDLFEAIRRELGSFPTLCKS